MRESQTLRILNNIKNMKIKVEIVNDELETINIDNVLTAKYIDVNNYQHTKELHVESILDEMVDEILLDIKWVEEKWWL
jgi:hypothetical protein